MTHSIQDITQKLIIHYQPDRIILFGSGASGQVREDSDLDLFIIKETARRPLERRMEVERILADRDRPLDIFVYTSGEVRSLWALGSPFIMEVMEKGRLVYMRQTTSGWLKDAEDELETGSILIRHEKYRGACYHCQQAAEKALKALILEKGKNTGKIHDIVDLLNRARKLGWAISFEMDSAVFLNSIYKGRYLTDEGLLPMGEPRRRCPKGV